jgi:Flp pilus assembly protein TadD
MDNRSKEYAKSSVEVLDTTTGRLIHTLIGHTAELVGIRFSPDGRRIATASLDRTIKLWDTATGREVFTLRGHTAGVLALAFSPDGRRIVSGAIDFTAHIWDATPLPPEVLRAQDARHQQKREAFAELARTTEDFQRVESLARNGQWDQAAAAFGHFVERDPNKPELRYPHIRSLVESGDRAGVRRACDELLKSYEQAIDDTQIWGVIWSCVLTPDAVTDREAPVRLAQSYLARHPEEKGREKSDGLNALGAALYRTGRYEAAVRHLNESIQALDGEGALKGFAFLAMAHHRLGHHDEARRWLDKLTAYQPKEGADFSWDDVVIRILRREVESLVLGSRPAAPPSAPPAPIKQATGEPAAKSR